MTNSSLVSKAIFLFFVLNFFVFNGFSATYNVSSSTELLTALSNVEAGDEILLAPGVYSTSATTEVFPTADGGTFNKTFFFRGTNDGIVDYPITIKSADAFDPAILVGNGTDDNGYVLFITGNYWVIENIKIESGAKGLVLDSSNNSIIKNVEIYNIGQEGIHVRDGSSNTLIDSVNVHDIGTRNDGFGEGIYIGSDNSVWWEGDGFVTGENGKYYKRATNNTVIINSTIGPNITAEPFDIKEGTENTIVENCIIYGLGISGNNFADSHIDIKGNTAKIRCNTFYQNNNTSISRGIMIVPRINAGVESTLTANGNIIHDNTFNLEAEDVEVLVANSGAGITYAWDNTRIPEEGNFYNSRITELSPSGYANQCDGTILTPNLYTLSISIIGQGNINLSPSGGVYEEGTEVILTAEANNGNQFDNWSGDADGTNTSITITINSNTDITANFSEIDVMPNQYIISTSIIGLGSVNLNPIGGVYEEGAEVTLTAVTDDGNQFDNWSGDVSGITTSITVTVNSNMDIRAHFSEIIDSGSQCENATPISLSFEQDGLGNFCWVTSGNINFINSWNLNSLTINGVDYTNIWSNTMPSKINGNYYISYDAYLNWSHFEVNGSSSKNIYNELNEDNGIQLFPNPFAYTIQLDFENEEIIDISVFDQIGRLVEFYNPDQTIEGMKIGQNLNSGSYYIKLRTLYGVKTFDVVKY